MKKRITSVILALCLSLFLLPVTAQAAGAASGSCGPTANWSYDAATKTLTISGSGAMDDFPTNNREYNHYDKDTEKLIVENGITAIGDYAFSDFESLASVSLPDSVTAIGKYAFSYCRALTSIEIPSGVTEIPEEAFSVCTNLERVTFPATLNSIGELAFSGCVSLTEITLPAGLKTIKQEAFIGVPFTRLIIPDGVTRIEKAAFNCGTLSALYIPASVEYLDSDPISCSSLRDIYFGGNETRWKAIHGLDVEYNIHADNPLLVHYNSAAKLADISARTEDDLQKLIAAGIAAGDSLIDIQLTNDITLSKTLTIPQGPTIGERVGEVRIDLNGRTITSNADPVISVEGALTVRDTTAVDDPVVDISKNDPVTYRSGCIRTDTSDKHTAINVRYGGMFILESGKIDATNIGIRVLGKESDIYAEYDTKAEINGGYVTSTESAIAVLGGRASVLVHDGVLLSKDNAVIAGNGLPQYAGTSIGISGGTLISKSSTPGYIPCGVYHPQNGTLVILSSTIHAEGGVGILMRGGRLRVPAFSSHSTRTPPEIIVSGTGDGSVGDSAYTVPAGHPVVIDQKSGYYDYTEIRYQKDVVSLPDSLKDRYAPHYISSPGYKLESKEDTSYLDQPGTLYYLQNTGAYRIKLDFNGGTGACPKEMTTVDGKLTDKQMRAPDSMLLHRDGYTFDGWYTALEGGEKVGPDYVFTSEITIYAHWKQNGTTDPDNPDTPKTFTVTFDAQSGSAVAAQSVTGGGMVTKPADPTREGYTFGGWYKEADCTTAWKFDTDTVTADITLYAKWAKVEKPPVDPDDEDEYRIYGPGSISGGRVYISHTTAEPGTRVTIELRPWRDYELNWLSAVNLDTDRKLRLTERYSDEYTFIMPAGDVEVDAAFYDRYYYYSGTYYVQEEEPVQVRPVKWYYSNGRIYHVTDGLVPYGSLLTRDMLLSVLYNMDPASTGDPTAWATNNGIIPDIYTSILWGTDKPINREQTAMILFCYAQHMGYNTAQRTDLTGYADYRQIRDIARPAVSWARAVGIISGSSATTLSPQAVLTCDQANSILSRFSVSVARQW